MTISNLVFIAALAANVNALWMPEKRAESTTHTATKTEKEAATKKATSTSNKQETTHKATTHKASSAKGTNKSSVVASSSANAILTTIATTTATPTTTLVTSSASIHSSTEALPSSTATSVVGAAANNTSSSSSSSSGGLIGGIIAAIAVVILGAAAFLVARKKKKARQLAHKAIKSDPFTMGFGNHDPLPSKQQENNFPPSSAYESKMNISFPTPPTTVTSPTPNIPIIGKFVVVATFVPTLSDELDIEPGDQIDLLVEYDDGWCQGINVTRGNQKGVFPRHCIDFMTVQPPHRGAVADVERSKRVSSMYPLQ
ncbi:hypothetical protein CU098_012606 [Rhizopus stolonifer]|uniref:SH3 domain-containing protein n=1 Tax=Rhizopus stolonifer TaxID=4846 RepID=A0A367KV31_RHIST|nr:hypothetical protein CU098_012606 [Rhizopus stolonifer]